MKNFPIPYANELVYSTIARAGIRWGITSPKCLLDEVFGSRQIIATLDLPSYLETISTHLRDTGAYSSECLIYNHTLYPLYAPFIGRERRKKAIEWMKHQSRGALHLALGVNASSVNAITRFRFCPVCLREQIEKNGEPYWSRLWFLPGINCCPTHGVTLISLKEQMRFHRHEFKECSPFILNTYHEYPNVDSKEVLISKKAEELLRLMHCQLPSQRQWTLFYKKLAHDFGCSKGSNIHYDEIYQKVKPVCCISELDFKYDSETNWLHSIFRKHRTSFSYLQHLTVWMAFLPDHSVKEVITKVLRVREPKSQNTLLISKKTSLAYSDEKRDLWIKLTADKGIKRARSSNKALYAWLYRNDVEWLRKYNYGCRLKSTNRKERINWRERDLSLSKRLLLFVEETKDADTPRLTKSYLMKSIGYEGMIRNHKDDLPIVISILDFYCESVSDYQIRRIWVNYDRLIQKGIPPARWRLLRASGLSDVRLTTIASGVLEQLEV